MRKALRLVFLVLASLLVLIGIASIAAHFLTYSSAPAIAFTAFGPAWLIAPLVGLILFAILRRWLGSFIGVLTVALCVVVQLPMFLGTAAADRGVVLTVMQANIRLGEGDPAALAKLVRDNHVDILAVSELTVDAMTKLDGSTLSLDLPYTYTNALPQADGTGIYSRYPLESTEQMDGYAMTNLSAVTLVPGGGIVQLYALHLIPPYPHATRWSTEIDRARSTLAAVPSDRRVIALGDFNSTWDHRQYREFLRGGYRDAAETVGAKWLPTYPTNRWYPPMLQIDHVLVRGASVASVRSYSIPGSDHRALIARIPLG
ncbi:endonuclease/exonuclease/phosphatase family protein [Tsukamurella soli]